MSSRSPNASSQILHSSAGKGWHGIDAGLFRFSAGTSHAPADERHVLGMHVGTPVKAECKIGDSSMRRLQKPGDMDFIPAGAEGAWEDDGECHLLLLTLQPELFEQAARELGKDLRDIDLAPRLQMRDAGIEALCLAIKADLEADVPSDALYIEHVASALAMRLIHNTSKQSLKPTPPSSAKMPTAKLNALLEYIESNLGQALHLSALAEVAGVSATRLKSMFRNSTGLPVYQYVIRRRIELARALLATTTMPASDIALVAGFAHQSHMASTMQRILGHPPGHIARPVR